MIRLFFIFFLQLIFFLNLNADEIDLNDPFYKLGWKNLENSTISRIEIPDVTSFLPNILIDSLKAKSSSNADIQLKIIDHRTSKEQDRGFSVKSQLGSPSHLLNHSGRKTCFGYILRGFTPLHLNRFRDYISQFRN